MKRFLISAKRYEGEVQIFYAADGFLKKIDYSGAKLSLAQIEAFGNTIPPCLDQLQHAFASKSVTIVEGEYEVSFEDFYREYPYKRNAHKAREYWPKMSKTEQVLAYEAAIEYRKYCERNQWYNPKIAEGWLKGKEFLNDWKKM